MCNSRSVVKLYITLVNNVERVKQRDDLERKFIFKRMVLISVRFV